MAQAAGDAEEKLDKHRFLVQSKIVEDGDYAAIQELPAAERVAEVCPQKVDLQISHPV